MWFQQEMVYACKVTNGLEKDKNLLSKRFGLIPEIEKRQKMGKKWKTRINSKISELFYKLKKKNKHLQLNKNINLVKFNIWI